MNRLITFIAALCISTSALAIDSRTVDSAGFDKLSDQQRAEIVKLVADKASQAKHQTETAAVDQAERWVNIGSQVGKGMVGAAKEMGVAVNEFANSPVGMREQPEAPIRVERISAVISVFFMFVP